MCAEFEPFGGGLWPISGGLSHFLAFLANLSNFFVSANFFFLSSCNLEYLGKFLTVFDEFFFIFFICRWSSTLLVFFVVLQLPTRTLGDICGSIMMSMGPMLVEVVIFLDFCSRLRHSLISVILYHLSLIDVQITVFIYWILLQ